MAYIPETNSVIAFQSNANNLVAKVSVVGVDFGNSSVITVTNQGTSPWVIQSIVGTYAEDAAHVTADKGIFNLAVRNDTMSSITSADGDYSPNAVGPVGERITANAPITQWVQGVTSVMYGTSVQALAPQGSSIFTYVTAVQIANDSPNYSRVTFTGGLGGTSSLLGIIPVPATGGAIVTLPNAWKTGANMGVSASISGISSVYVSLQGFISKT